MNRTRFYVLFHLNLAYSSIEEEKRRDVIRRCYWPLLETIERDQIPIAIEASGFTLETIYSLDPAWTSRLRELASRGLCEFVGSGYAQLIGPLVPAPVNRANLMYGNRVYEQLLGIKPKLALVNEQALSGGLLGHYAQAGYQGILMEWNNIAAVSNWPSELRYSPQHLSDDAGNTLPVVWTDSIGFQQFQRYVHGEIDRINYEAYISRHIAERTRTICLYANDAEIFDFRPGRYTHEPDLDNAETEWLRIGALLRDLKHNSQYQYILPGELVRGLDQARPLRLNSACLPIPVKKQGKYNVLRWAVTGRNDTDINTRCWRIFDAIRDRPFDDPLWRELCYLWSSDFRTHITPSRWERYQNDLCKLETLAGVRQTSPMSHEDVVEKNVVAPTKNVVELATPFVHANLNCRRGAAIVSVTFKEFGDRPAIGTLPHGYFDDIRWCADWYSGHLTYEGAGRHKITDLAPVECRSLLDTDTRSIVLSTRLKDLGTLSRKISANLHRSEFSLTYSLAFSPSFDGVLRCGYLTLMPELFDRRTLFYATHNGGEELEYFDIKEAFDHGASVSQLVSANTGLGATQGIVIIGDREKALQFRLERSEAAVIPMIQYQPIGESYLLRVYFSLQELDETRVFGPDQRMQFEWTVHITPYAAFSNSGQPK